MKTLKEMVLSGELVDRRFYVGGIGEPFYFCYRREIGGKRKWQTFNVSIQLRSSGGELDCVQSISNVRSYDPNKRVQLF